VIMSLTYSLSAYPVGILSDHMDRAAILIVGLALLVIADLTLAFATGIVGIIIGVGLWGLHMGFTQGLLATLVAATAPQELRGTAFGIFNLITGLTLLAASIIAGALWDAAGPQGTFLAGAGFAMATIASLLSIRRRLAGFRSLRQAVPVAGDAQTEDKGAKPADV
jgi:MFS family permease